MAKKKPPNQGQRWTPADDRKLEHLADGNTPTGLIAHKLGRSEEAVRSRASDQNVSLKPTNQSPYGPRRKKR
jgi:hypothetical protein